MISESKHVKHMKQLFKQTRSEKLSLNSCYISKNCSTLWMVKTKCYLYLVYKNVANCHYVNLRTEMVSHFHMSNNATANYWLIICATRWSLMITDYFLTTNRWAYLRPEVLFIPQPLSDNLLMGVYWGGWGVGGSERS